MTTLDSGSWLEASGQRLRAASYSLTDDVAFESTTFLRVAYRSGFQLAKFGNVETFFVFGALPTADAASIRAFSARAFRYAKSAKKLPLPCGMFEAVVAYPVALVDSLDSPTRATIEGEMPSAHYGAFEMPVVYESSRGELGRTPLRITVHEAMTASASAPASNAHPIGAGEIAA